jgi:hypothetical protein
MVSGPYAISSTAVKLTLLQANLRRATPAAWSCSNVIASAPVADPSSSDCNAFAAVARALRSARGRFAALAEAFRQLRKPSKVVLDTFRKVRNGFAAVV